MFDSSFEWTCKSMKEVEEMYSFFLPLMISEVYSIENYPIITKTVYQDKENFILSLDVE